MSLESWKAKFYPVPANEVARVDAVAHSLQKWKGLREYNMSKHLVRIDCRTLTDSKEVHDDGLSIDIHSCALCRHYFDPPECVHCPLAKVLGNACDETDAPFDTWQDDYDPEPMIMALEDALSYEQKQKQKETGNG